MATYTTLMQRTTYYSRQILRRLAHCTLVFSQLVLSLYNLSLLTIHTASTNYHRPLLTKVFALLNCKEE